MKETRRGFDVEFSPGFILFLAVLVYVFCFLGAVSAFLD